MLHTQSIEIEKHNNLEKLAELKAKLEHNRDAIDNESSPWHFKNPLLEARLTRHEIIREFDFMILLADTFLDNPDRLWEKDFFYRIEKNSNSDLPRTITITKNEAGDYFVIAGTNSKAPGGILKNFELSKKTSGSYKQFSEGGILFSSIHGPVKLAKLRIQQDLIDHPETINEYRHPKVGPFPGYLPTPAASHFMSHAHLENKMRKFGGFLLPSDPNTKEGTAGTTLHFFHRTTPMNLDVKNKLVYDLISGIMSMHTVAGMAHLNLTPMNLLVMPDAEGNLSLKIFNFCSAEKLGDQVYQKLTSISYASPEAMSLNLQPTSACKAQYEEMLKDSKSLSYDLTQKKGTTLQQNLYFVHPRDDLWAIGLIIINLYTHLNPEHPEHHEEIAKLFNTKKSHSQETIRCWNAIPEELHSFLQELFSPKVRTRNQCTLEQLKTIMEDILQPAAQRISPRP